MATVLVEWQGWISKRTFLYPRPTHSKKFRSIATRVCEIIDGNENDDRQTRWKQNASVPVSLAGGIKAVRCRKLHHGNHGILLPCEDIWQVCHWRYQLLPPYVETSAFNDIIGENCNPMKTFGKTCENKPKWKISHSSESIHNNLRVCHALDNSGDMGMPFWEKSSDHIMLKRMPFNM